MNFYRCHHVYVTSDCVEFFPHNTPLPYKSSAENSIIAAQELAYALQKSAPQAKFSNIGKSQLVTIETLSKIFTKAAEDRKSTEDPTHKQADHLLVYLRHHSQDGINISPHHSPMPLEMKRG